MRFPSLTADEAAALIENGETIALSGFTPAGTPKAVPAALAARARTEHDAGRPFRVAVITGASTGPSADGELAKADAISWRTPYQTNKDLRDAANSGRCAFFDMHLSMVPQAVRYGFLGGIDTAIIEAADIKPNGEILLTTAVGGMPSYARMARRVIVELNSYHPSFIRGLHDLYEPLDPPYRRPIPLNSASGRIGTTTLKLDPRKIVGIVRTSLPDEARSFEASDAETQKIGENVADFLAGEMRAGRIPPSFLPLQSGVGNIANAVLAAMGEHSEIPPFDLYSEVVQDGVIELIEHGKVRFASGTSLSVTPDVLQKIYGDWKSFRKKLVLRPQEISNNPEVIRRLGIVSINTAIEADLWGNINSTHVMGSKLMNGIGGSGDFTRNAYLSIFTTPSTAKDGAISTIVPLVSHLDHSEHSVGVIITEQGVADLRGKSPAERAALVIEKCAHPDYREALHAYLRLSHSGHIPQTLSASFAFHEQFIQTGSMTGVRF